MAVVKVFGGDPWTAGMVRRWKSLQRKVIVRKGEAIGIYCLVIVQHSRIGDRIHLSWESHPEFAEGSVPQ